MYFLITETDVFYIWKGKKNLSHADHNPCLLYLDKKVREQISLALTISYAFRPLSNIMGSMVRYEVD